MIQVQSLTKTYGKNQTLFTALQDINLTIQPGQTVAIVGKSGSGKSTLMHCLSGLDRAQQGTIIINDQNLNHFKDKQMDQFRAQTMGFIFQSFFVQGNESCYDNVSLPLETAGTVRSQRASLVEKALAAVELSDKLKTPAKNLSGGQKQRLAIARAIVNSPTILFADEPTGNLDSQTGQVIEDLLFSYSQQHQATLIIVTHDTDLANKCQMQVHLKDGRIEQIISSENDKKKVGEIK